MSVRNKSSFVVFATNKPPNNSDVAALPLREALVKAFADKDLDEDVALMNARLAKILTNKEYDGQVIPWCPTDASN